MSTQVFNVKNSSFSTLQVLAVNAADAAKIAVELKHARSVKTTTVTGPIDLSTDSVYTSLKALIDTNQRGLIAKRLPMHTLNDFLMAVAHEHDNHVFKKGEGEWQLIRPAHCAI